MSSLSTKDKQKPFILVFAAIGGIVAQMTLGRGIPWLTHVTEIGVFLVITAIMIPVELREVAAASKKVKATLLAVVINFLVIPGVAWALGWLFLRNYPDFWVGAILYALTPCIGWYLIFIDLAKGNVAWGVALLPWNVTLQVLLLPAYLYLLVGHVIPIEASALVYSILLYLVAPIVLAIVVRRLVIARRGREYFDSSFKHRLGSVKLWTLVGVIVSMFLSQNPLTFSELASVSLLIAFLIGFFVVLFVLALVIGRLFRLNYEDNTTLAFTTTARNSEAVIGVAISAFPGHPLVYLAIILGPIVELPVLLVIARLMLSMRSWIGVPKATAQTVDAL